MVSGTCLLASYLTKSKQVCGVFEYWILPELLDSRLRLDLGSTLSSLECEQLQLKSSVTLSAYFQVTMTLGSNLAIERLSQSTQLITDPSKTLLLCFFSQATGNLFELVLTHDGILLQ